ncbi:hypothetical protein [Ralstonia pseudosolanacearum]|uniref:hypothetical protein n=1 Tax=Ralstonia pseudosolanacearum TaxID=1310165 RepID=UPI0023DA4C45|nr:hypothetical protein [Ralstonia pseudosolanacearum]
MLDRTPATELWDDFFLERWRRFTVAELEAIATWIDWVSTEDGVVLDDVALPRALLNIDLLVSLAQENKG